MTNDTEVPDAVAGMIQFSGYQGMGKVLKSRKFLRGGHRIASQQGQ